MDEDVRKQTNEELLSEVLFETVDNYNVQRTGSVEREKESGNVVKLADALAKLKQIEIEKEDREERRRIEEERNRSNIEFEREKLQLNAELEREKEIPFWQSCIEWSVKYILPGCISGALFNKFQKRTLQFEETGTFRSKASKDLRSGWSFWK